MSICIRSNYTKSQIKCAYHTTAKILKVDYRLTYSEVDEFIGNKLCFVL